MDFAPYPNNSAYNPELTYLPILTVIKNYYVPIL